MNRTTTIVVALIAAAGLSTMVYAVPAQRALAWGGGFFGGCGGWGGCGGCGFGWGGCGGGFFGGCGFGCGGGFFVHKTIIQTINQVNHCTGGGEDENGRAMNGQQGQQGKVVCLNTATNTAGNGFGEGGGLR